MMMKIRLQNVKREIQKFEVEALDTTRISAWSTGSNTCPTGRFAPPLKRFRYLAETNKIDHGVGCHWRLARL